MQHANYIYQYDDKNNIIGLTVKNEYDIIVDDYDYFYDGFNQLIRENVNIKNGSFGRTYLYNYDDQGNIVSIYDYAYTYYNEITTPLKGITYYEYSNTWKDQLTKFTEYTNSVKTKEIVYSYDANGNPTSMTDLMNSYQSKTLSWDGRQLSGMSYYCGGMSFKYNDQGIRTYKSIGGCSGGYSVNYVLDGSRILSETKGSSTIYYTYDHDGTLISMNYNGNEYFYITNMQGDVVELVDINGNTVVEYRYDAWGNIIYQTPNQTIGNINPFRYRSNYYDIETGWYYLQSRYYNPSIGRFISADGLVGEIGDIQSQNMYAYCANNPVMLVDNDGEFGVPAILALALVSAIVNAVSQLVSNVFAGKTGKQVFDGVVGAAIGSAVNTTLLLTMWYVPGNFFIAAFAGGAVTTIFNFLEDAIIWKKVKLGELALDFVLTSASNLAGNFLGAKAVKVGKTWIQTTHFKSIFTGPFGQRLLAQSGIAAVLNGIVNFIRTKLEGVFDK